MAVAVLLAIGWTPLAHTQPVDAVSEGWQQAIYANGRVLPLGGGFEISTPSGSGGLYLRKRIAKDQRFRFIVAGSLVSSAPNLRVQLDEGEPRWFSAPNGQFEMPIVGVAVVEALIYSDGPFVYRLDAITLEPCPLCRSDRERLAIVEDLFPNWSIKLYGTPDLSRSTLGVLIENTRPAHAGLIFEKTGLIPDRRYRVELDGEIESADTSARFDIDESPPQWVHLAEGSVDRIISGTAALKVWIYSDIAFRYDLQGIRLVDCGSCVFDIGRSMQSQIAHVRRAFGKDVAGGVGASLNLLSYFLSVVLAATAVIAAWRPPRTDRNS